MNQKELTRITTLQITEIVQLPEEHLAGDKDGYAKTMAEDIKKDYGFDDVVVLSAQDFIRNKKEEVEQQ